MLEPRSDFLLENESAIHDAVNSTVAASMVTNAALDEADHAYGDGHVTVRASGVNLAAMRWAVQEAENRARALAEAFDRYGRRERRAPAGRST